MRKRVQAEGVSGTRNQQERNQYTRHHLVTPHQLGESQHRKYGYSSAKQDNSLQRDQNMVASRRLHVDTTTDTNQHQRLPSFNDLTRTFENTLTLDQSIPQGPPVRVISHGSRPHVVQPQQPRPLHAPQQLVTPVSRDPPQQVIYPSPVAGFHQRQQQSHTHTPNVSTGHSAAPTPGPNPTYRFPSSPANAYPSLIPQQLGAPFHTGTFRQTPTGLAGSASAGPVPAVERNYIATSAEFPPNAEFQPAPQHMGRRHSLQFPPYPSHHAKQDSYDSQTSLSTLAVIASSSADLTSLLKGMENCLDRYSSFSRVMHDLHVDFITQIHNDQHNQGSTRLPLLFEYVDSNNNLIKDIDIEHFKHVVANIPFNALTDMMSWLDEMRAHFEAWVSYREAHGMGPPASISANPIMAAAAFSAQSSQEAGDSSHQRRDSVGAVRRRRTDESSSQVSHKVHKKRKSISHASSKKKENVSMLVKPPTPVVGGDSSGAPGGDFNEDLSVKPSQHSCQQCGNEDTPEWRRGPYGSRSLCNACGLFYSKLLKKFSPDEAKDLMIRRRESGNGEDRRIPMD
ncbi:CYFA0S01e18382g1_1 [Cyberlindnera fabianii]|uniref:CYFA0S01e18382g1_1 n=1 Tax=Cyberlindnera fabianii TaxID=36022 RepID=A0A061AR70_CYBFA|nr:CYFA0S01e18382g1_1 [Cyberlindnera fabianii]